jgi:hypothetical protein
MLHVSCSSIIIFIIWFNYLQMGLTKANPHLLTHQQVPPSLHCVIADLGILELKYPLKNTLQAWRKFIGVSYPFKRLKSS